MSGMHTNWRHVGLSLCVEAHSKGRFGSSLIVIDAHRNERLLDQGIQVTGNISRAISDWVSPNDAGSSARHQSRPDAIFVRSILGRQAHFDPTKIPPQDRVIHFVVEEAHGSSEPMCLLFLN
eukprot:1145943-Pelagomonas_calceolata.AAC.1